jgi:hypothetical protein
LFSFMLASVETKPQYRRGTGIERCAC